MLRLLSWNLFGLSDDHLDVRTEAAMFVALLGGPPEVVLAGGPITPPPDVLMFQEVVERSHVAHLRPHLTAAGYTLVPAEPHPEREYYELIAVRQPQGIVSTDRVRFGSAQGRELLRVETEVDGQRHLWLTAHIESLQSGAVQRMAQSVTVLEALAAFDGPAVFAGDTNLRETEAARIAQNHTLTDAWEACGASPAERWTYTSQRTRRGNRYDRIWGGGVRFSGFRCLGRDDVTLARQPPSDHLGVEVRLEAT